MILQALKEYYDRKAADPESGIAPEGWEKKEIPFVVVLNKKGEFVCIEDTQEGEGKKKRAKTFLVPQAIKKTSGIAANLLWDTVGYVFGIDTKGKPERAIEQKAAFISRIKEVFTDKEEIQPLLDLLESITISQLEQEPLWKEIVETNANLTFRFSEEHELLCRNTNIQNAIDSISNNGGDAGICLVTGKKAKISTLHTAIKGVYGAQSSGANIVSFNLDAFRSFNKEQGQNAPVSESAVFAYTTAINTLLSKDSRQRMSIGDASTVFWSEKETVFEITFLSLFTESPKDDPDAGTRAVRELYESVNNGAFSSEKSNNRFYILGLSPNAARIAVRFWLVSTIEEFAVKIKKHFDDFQIIKPPKEPEYYSLWRILVNVASQDKSENIPPNIAGEFMRSILSGTPYPATLLQAALRRIHSDTENRVKPVRAAIIKAYLNRYYRIHSSSNHKEILMSLDETNPSPGYQFGRLFAVLEKCQRDALGKEINSTIADRYYSSASSTPAVVFPILMRMNQHHLSKIESDKIKMFNRKLIESIMQHVDDFKAHLDLHEQSRFAIGYYHQKQDFFNKKDNSEINS